MFEKEANRSVAAFALFPDDVIRDMVTLARSGRGADLPYTVSQARKAYAPPALFGAASERYCYTEQEACNYIYGSSLMFIAAFQRMGAGTNDYSSIIRDALNIDEKEAQKIGGNINTIDDATGITGNMGYALASMYNALFGAFGKIDPNTKTDDIDAGWELARLGKFFIEEGLPRMRMLIARSENAYGMRLNEALTKAQAAEGSGDLDQGDFYYGEVAGELARGAYAPEFLTESGGPLADFLKATKGKAREALKAAAQDPELKKKLLKGIIKNVAPGAGAALGLIDKLSGKSKADTAERAVAAGSKAGTEQRDSAAKAPILLDISARVISDAEKGDLLLGND